MYGIAIAIGNMIGGKLSNHNPIRALFYMFLIQAIILFVLTFTAPFKVAGLITIIFMGLFAFMNVPGLQVYVVMLAERFVPSAVDVASAILRRLTPGLLWCLFRWYCNEFVRVNSYGLGRRHYGSRCCYFNSMEYVIRKRDQVK